ncbi:hypothetical protein IU501_32860 [Nocardia otitidiscaviarum]|uniref:hypothetical protein n=1 Tax=Nocardia otitidiscaviarum TaxID=1823 RepID=UPI0004A6D259|nr:hypothetical protein [Nocardia otitidiscaviarum]MBF6137763.1 hypothetical protein [Nocardia otitidiscaviarum]MBF6485284.1 hypothetical protein [Nocardia otitidiscaviarum]
MFDEERYQPCRWVDPPIEVRVQVSDIWPPQRLRWGSATPLWQKVAGLRVDQDVPGRLEEVVVTSVGDPVGRVRFAPLIGKQRTAENMLLPLNTWHPVRDADVQRLRTLLLELGIEFPA